MHEAHAVDPLRVRWLGRVPYREALAVQQALFDHGRGQHLLLLEHDHVFTYGPHADLDTNLRCNPADVGADFVRVKRGGDITYHGPGQLVGYPIVSPTHTKGSLRHVRAVEDLLIATLAELGIASAGRLSDYPGVWVDAEGANPRKIAAIGVRLARGRTMHGFALNLTTDMAYLREHIVACGIADLPVTSLAEEGPSASGRRRSAMATRSRPRRSICWALSSPRRRTNALWSTSPSHSWASPNERFTARSPKSRVIVPVTAVSSPSSPPASAMTRPCCDSGKAAL